MAQSVPSIPLKIPSDVFKDSREGGVGNIAESNNGALKMGT